MSPVGTHHDVRKHFDLTGRQRQVIELMARGHTNYQIGQALGISLDGAKWHVSEIIGKLDVTSREEAVAYWRAYNRPMARLSRAMNAVSAGGIFRWVGVGAGGVVIASAVLLAVTIYGGGSSSAPAIPDDSDTPSPTAPVPELTPTPVSAVVASTPTPDAIADTPLTVHFLREGEVAAVQRMIPSTVAVGRAALEQLIAGPSAEEAAAGITSAVPSGSEILGLTIDDELAIVDLSTAFLDGDETDRAARFAQVVYTLTQFSTVESVQFVFDGELLTGESGGAIDLSAPLSRSSFEDHTPAIYVDVPALGTTVTPPLTISGTANTFEATFQLAITDADGTQLAAEIVTATSGSGVRGEFEITVALDPSTPGPVILRVYEASAEDGSHINVVEIPITISE